MATITITIPETDEIPASEFLESAARGYGWDPAQGITAEEAILDQLERDLHFRFRNGASHLSQDTVEAEMPLPETRGQKAQRELEEVAELARAGGPGRGEGGRA